GTLTAEQRRTLEQRLMSEPILAAEVANWETRLGGLADEVAPVAPPAHTWDRIEAALRTPTAARPRAGLWESLMFWRGLSFASLALAALLAAVTFVAAPLRDGGNGPMVATLNVTGGAGGFMAAVSDGRVTVMPAAFSDASQRALELWLIPAGDH